MKLHFSKMHGLGNDFVVFNTIDQPFELSTAQLQSIANRHEGIGCDQILLVAAPMSPDADFQYR
ncbi:MAG: diaminopimelate epimerase, partial [Pseudomonadota bacterium]